MARLLGHIPVNAQPTRRDSSPDQKRFSRGSPPLSSPTVSIALAGAWRFSQNMKKRIVGFHLDDEQHWVAKLECGHNQHVRHNPPWIDRPWVMAQEGRHKALGHELNCMKCDIGAPPDWRPTPT